MISVLMSVYNEPKQYVEKSVESILNQEYTDYEFIIVIDDPDNHEVIHYLKETAKSYSNIHLIINEVNLGLVKSLNKALSSAKGEFIARMDADDISLPRRFGKELETLEKLDVDLVGSNIKNLSENGKETGKVTNFPTDNDRIKKFLRYDDCIPHPTWLSKRAVYDQLKGYQNIDACEDYDFLVRAALNGFTFANVPEPLLMYRINKNGISATKKAQQKATLNFIRSRYRKGLVTTENQCCDHFYSGEGEKDLRNYQRYYIMSNKLKEKKNKISYFVYGAYMFASSKKAREILKNIQIENKL